MTRTGGTWKPDQTAVANGIAASATLDDGFVDEGPDQAALHRAATPKVRARTLDLGLIAALSRFGGSWARAVNNEDQMKQDPPGPTRRQFLGGLATGTVAVGAVTQAGCGPAVPPLKTLGSTPTTHGLPLLRRRLRPGRVHARRHRHQHRG